MKIFENPSAFVPVIIKLESQDELDTLRAILNHTPIVSGTPFSGACKEFEKLGRHGDDDTRYSELIERLSKAYKA